jgi:hypothetical protein
VAYANGRSDWHNYTDESLAASDEDKNADPDSEIEQEEYSSASDVADTNQDEPAMDSFPGATYQNSPDDQDETMVDSDQDSDTEEESSEPDEDEISKPLSRNTYYIAVSNRFTHTERVQASAASNQYTYTDEDESVAASDQDIEEEELESSAVSYRVTYSDDEKMNPGPLCVLLFFSHPAS